jgi:hypothetical protein
VVLDRCFFPFELELLLMTEVLDFMLGDSLVFSKRVTSYAYT